MYEKFFNLTESPFNLTPDPRFFFLSRKHEAALSHLLYGIKERKGFIAITGEVGTGKTTLCRLLLSRLDSDVKTSLLFNPGLTTIELLQAINDDFGIGIKSNSKKELVDVLNVFLLQQLKKGSNAVLIIDEAQNLSLECLEEIRILSNIETEKEKLLQIVIIGQPELRQKLELQTLRQLNQRIALRYHIEPLDLQETSDYIHYRLKVAGGEEGVFFTPQAIKGVYRYSNGIPRLINAICDKVLLAAYVAESKTVTDAYVGEAAEDLNLSRTSEIQKTTDLHAAKPGRWQWVGIGIAGFLLFGLIGIYIYLSSIPETSSTTSEARQTDSEITKEASPEERLTPPIGFDLNGVYRVRDKEDSGLGAAYTILRLWKIKETGREDSQDVDPLLLGSRYGLDIYRIPLNIDIIRNIGYPCIIKFQEEGGGDGYYVVLAEIGEKNALILDPIYGRSIYSTDKLQGQWSGEAVVWWKKVDGLDIPFSGNFPSSAVMRLQEILVSLGFFKEIPTGYYGPKTIEAIKEFQKRMNIKVDGIFGAETHIVLARAHYKDKIPLLERPL